MKTDVPAICHRSRQRSQFPAHCHATTDSSRCQKCKLSCQQKVGGKGGRLRSRSSNNGVGNDFTHRVGGVLTNTNHTEAQLTVDRLVYVLDHKL